MVAQGVRREGMRDYVRRVMSCGEEMLSCGNREEKKKETLCYVVCVNGFTRIRFSWIDGETNDIVGLRANPHNSRVKRGEPKILHNHGLFKKIGPLTAQIMGPAGQSMDPSPLTHLYNHTIHPCTSRPNKKCKKSGRVYI